MAVAPQKSAPSVPLRTRTGRWMASFGTLFSLAAGIVVITEFGEVQRAIGTTGSDVSIRLSAAGAASGHPPFLLQMNNGAELDGDQPTPVSGPDGNLDHGDLFYDNRTGTGSKLYTADHPMAVYPTAEYPDADGCQDAVATFGVWSVKPVLGQVLCVQTTEGQIIAVTIRQVQADSVKFDDTILG